MLTKLIILLFLSLTFNGIAQQNLVLNWSIENYTSCPTGLGQTSLLNDISNPNLGTPDFFHSCSTSIWPDQVNVPGNFWGYQFPKNGDGYIGFGFYLNGNNVREYNTLWLSDTLITGQKYWISFWISLADSVKYTSDKIGALLHNNLISQSNIEFLPYQPQIENTTGNFISDDVNWIKIEGEYTASGGEKYITIGNFYPDSLTDTIALNNDPISSGNKFGTYFYIDSVSVTEILDTTSTGEVSEPPVQINIFPNPSNGNITLNYHLSDLQNSVFKIYNSIGQLVFEENLTQKNGVKNLQTILPNGVYIWTVEADAVILKREKMVVQE